ncbi:30S ribosomal protein S27ae [archaeon]|nr:MAG: 30S ribosomal protein S27ae [archaeon]
MAVLKYYQVDKDGKVVRARKDCPSETCGAGVRMAAHKNRLHCGKCSLTYMLEGKK